MSKVAPRLLLSIALILATSSVFMSSSEAQVCTPDVPHLEGQWSTLPYLMPINPISATLLRNGTVLIISGSENDAWNFSSGAQSYRNAIWDPTGTTQSSVTVQKMDYDVFCSSTTALPDGRPMVVGGTSSYAFNGENRASIFDPATGSFLQSQSMADGRWYGTGTALGDGRIMVFSGLGLSGGTNNTVEIYDVKTAGTGWTSPVTAPFTPPLYPRMMLLPNGKVFYNGQGLGTKNSNSWIFDPAPKTWAMSAPTTVDRASGPAILLPLLAPAYIPKVMNFGGGEPVGRSSTEIIDLSVASPSWTAGPNMSTGRVQSNLVILPNGKVLVSGGSVNNEIPDTVGKSADLYDPATNSFSPAGTASFSRLYHSTALLLPDATVASMGSNPVSRGSYEPGIEIYRPPYLFDANDEPVTDRPTITGVSPGVIGFNSTFSVNYSSNLAITSAVLIRPGSSTHASDMEQRLVSLCGPAPQPACNASSGTLTLTSPPNGNIAPPGYYMLFLLDSAGVPSIAQFVQLSPYTTTPPEGIIASPTSDTTINVGGTVSFGTNTTAASYSWIFPAGSPGTSTAKNPGNVTFNTAGVYVASLTVIDGNGNSDPSPATRTITVLPKSGDFKIDVTPPSVAIIPGQSATFSVTLTPIAGFKGTVNLSVGSESGFPTGISSGGFSPSSINTSGTSTLTINTTTSATPYALSLTVTGATSTISHTGSTTLLLNLAPPANLTATAGNAQVALSWSPTTGASGYNIKRAPVSGGPYVLVGCTTSTSYTEGGLVNGKTYYYIVSGTYTGGTDGAGEGSNSLEVNATPISLTPPAPTGLAAAAGNAQVELSWSASSGATTYNVKRATVSGGPYTTIASPFSTSYTDSGVSNGTTYYYVVSALNSAGESANSSQVSATPQATAPIITSLSPSSAIAGGAAFTMSVNGSNFVSGSVVRWNSSNRTTTFVSSTALTVAIPASDIATAGTSQVRVVNPNATTSNALNFTINSPAQLGLVAAYAFNEGSGTTVTDVSGSNNNGTISGATWTTAGKYGSALVFNGSSNVVTVPNSVSLGLTTAMTLEAWVYPTVTPTGWRSIVDKNTDGYYLMASSGTNTPTAGGTFTSGGQNVFAPSGLAINTWTHLAASFDGTSVRLYVNGVQVANQAQSTPLTTTTGTLQIGADSYGEYFTGRIDEIRVYNVALTAAQIQTDMNTPIGASTNTAPTISTIAAQTTNEDTATSAIAFTVGDAETAVGSLTVSGSSSNTTVVPNANIVFGGSGANRTVTLTPAANQNGTATITVTVSDGQLSTPTSFLLTVNAVNDAPTITSIAAQTTTTGTAVGPLNFTIGDVETAAGSLTVSGSSSNTTLVPNANIVFGGSGANRTVTVTPVSGQTGTATITVTVSDGQLNTPTSFLLTVTATNTVPTISSIAPQATNEDTATGAIPFTVGDNETAVGSLTVSGSSSNTTVVPNANIVFGGSGANRTVTLTPAANQNGTATITVTVSDGQLSTPTSFVLTVNAVNDAPTITSIAAQTTTTGTAVGPLNFTIGDVETAAASLTVSGSSSNTTLVPNANIVFGGSGANRTVTVTSASGQTGTATITITVSDGQLSTPTSFLLTVNAATPGLVAAYAFNEGSGTTVTDVSSSKNNGTISGATWTTAGKYGSALVFNGSSNVVTVPNSVSLGLTTAMTLEAWVYPTVTPTGWRSIVDKNTDGYYLMASSGTNTPTAGGTFTSGGQNVFAPSGLAINTWTHLAASFDGTSVRLYVNGVQVANQAQSTPLTTTTGTLQIGADSYGEYFTGRIDEIRVYNVALTAAQIQTDMNTPIGASTNTAPTISTIAAQTTNEDTATSAIAFTVGDAETAVGSLTVSGSSSNTTVVPNANIVFGGSGANRTVTLTPAANQNGTATITVTVSDGQLSTPTSFLLTVNAVNDAPTITSIAAQTTTTGTAVGPLNFTIGDVETAAASLTVSGSSSNTTLVPNANIVFGGSGANRTVTVTPAAGQSGTATITVTVSDGQLSTPISFLVTVTATNTAPTISTIAPQTTNEDTATGAIAFTVDDTETAVASLTVTGSSNNTTLVPNANIVFGGSGANRTVTLTPAANQNGTATITVTVSDGQLSTPTSFLLTVNAVNDAPTITTIADQSTTSGTPVGPLSFTISDVETAAASLTVSGSSSNTTLVPNANIAFGGSGANRTVTVTPAAGQSGTATITVTVSDGQLGTPISFLVTVTATNTAPTISTIAAQSTNEDTATGALAFTIDDTETAVGSLTVSGSSSNTTVVPNANIVFGGSGANRTVTLTPAANQNGTATITVTVSDGQLSTPTSFLLTVNAVNDAPTITTIADQSTTSGTAVGPISFTIGDVETAAASLTVSGSSSNTTLVPNANIAFGGSGANRTVTVTPAAGQSGTATITVTVSDGQLSTPISFLVTVTATNTAPTISTIAAQSTNEDTATGALAFTVDDTETAVASLTVTGSSNNTTLVPNANIVFGGSGANRTVTATPALNQNGTATITVTVSDGQLSTPTSFLLTVNAVNDAPTITTIADQSTTSGTAVGPLSFTISDVETAAASLTVSGSSSNTTLVPNANIVFGGSAANRTVTVTPAAGQSGTATITVTVSDGQLGTPISFLVTVTADTTAPETSLTTTPSNPSTNSNASFSFTSTEPGSFQCQLDGAGFAACTSPQNYIGLSQGSHNFQVQAIDLAGNFDLTPASYSWTIDSIAPDTAITAAPGNPSTSSSASFSFIATEPASFQCRLDGASFAACTSPQNYTALAQGSHTFQVQAIDLAGNIDPSPASYTWTYTPVTLVPASTVIEIGSLQGGTVDSLNADDNNYYAVNSTTSGTRTTSWYASFIGVSSNLSNLKISYKGKNSRNSTQTIAIWNWTSSSWVQLDSRNVNTTEILIANLSPPGTLGNYVSATGELRIQVKNTRSSQDFVTSGELVQIVYDIP